MKITLIVTCLITTASWAHAQSLYNQSLISIGPANVFFVKDSLINNGTIINNGDMQIGGAWTNNNQYDAGHGQITFNSDQPQVINHSNQSFSKLTISGGGKKMILADITIEEEIILSDGIIETANNSKVVINQTASIVGGSDLAHIHAPVYHHGSGDKLFPIGNGSVYLPVTLQAIEDPSTIVGVEAVELGSLSLGKAPSLDEISNQRYWHIDVVAGTLNSRITLPMRDETQFTDPEKVVVVQSPALTDQFESIGQSSATGTVSNGIVTSNYTVTTRSYVTLASSTDDGSLTVYNAISANGDGLNDYLRILNIEYYPENTFSVFTRWGDKVFEIQNYDNDVNVFRGKSNINGGKELVNGTYFYVIETKRGNQKINGFLVLKN